MLPLDLAVSAQRNRKNTHIAPLKIKKVGQNFRADLKEIHFPIMFRIYLYPKSASVSYRLYCRRSLCLDWQQFFNSCWSSCSVFSKVGEERDLTVC